MKNENKHLDYPNIEQPRIVSTDLARGLGSISLGVIDPTQPATAPNEAQVKNPYERLSDEMLLQVQENIADSIVRGVVAFDSEQVTSSCFNLLALQRELERRFPDDFPASERKITPEGVIRGTTLNKNIIQRITEVLKTDDGALNKLFGASVQHGTMQRPAQISDEEKIQHAEVVSLLSELQSEVGGGRDDYGSYLVQGVKDEYSIRTNEELDVFASRITSTIASLEAKGKFTEAEDKRQKLARIRAVQALRQAARGYSTGSPLEPQLTEESNVGSSNFELDVKAQVSSIHERAKREGRVLSDAEVEEIRNLAKSVKVQREKVGVAH